MVISQSPRSPGLNSAGATLSGEVLGVRLDFKAFRRLRCPAWLGKNPGAEALGGDYMSRIVRVIHVITDVCASLERNVPMIPRTNLWQPLSLNCPHELVIHRNVCYHPLGTCMITCYHFSNQLVSAETILSSINIHIRRLTQIFVVNEAPSTIEYISKNIQRPTMLYTCHVAMTNSTINIQQSNDPIISSNN